MIEGKKICVVLPAYNAARTLEQTVGEIPRSFVSEIRYGILKVFGGGEYSPQT